MSKPLEIGDIVEIIHERWFGVIAEVTDLRSFGGDPAALAQPLGTNGEPDLLMTQAWFYIRDLRKRG